MAGRGNPLKGVLVDVALTSIGPATAGPGPVHEEPGEEGTGLMTRLAPEELSALGTTWHCTTGGVA